MSTPTTYRIAAQFAITLQHFIKLYYLTSRCKPTCKTDNVKRITIILDRLKKQLIEPPSQNIPCIVLSTSQVKVVWDILQYRLFDHMYFEIPLYHTDYRVFRELSRLDIYLQGQFTNMFCFGEDQAYKEHCMKTIQESRDALDLHIERVCQDQRETQS